MRRAGRPLPCEAAALSRSIVEAALGEFRQRGFGGASIGRIAVAAGATRSAIYRRYADKQALFADVADVQIDKLQELANAAATTIADPLVALATTIRVYLHFILAPMALDLQRIIIAEATSFPALAQRIGGPIPAPLSERIDALIVAAERSGQLSAAPPGQWRDAVMRLMVDGCRWQALVDHTPWTDERIDADFDRVWPLFLDLAGKAR